MRRKLVIFAALLVVLVLLVAWFSLANHNQATKGRSATSSDTLGLEITNADQYSDRLGESTLSDIRDEAYRRVVSYAKEGHYQATIRANSFQSSSAKYTGTYPPTLVPQYEFLLDIPAVKQSYVVSFSGGPDYPYSILYVLCPQANQLIYGDFGCVDEQ